MKLTAKQLREIIDTLPNPREQRSQQRIVAIPQNISFNKNPVFSQHDYVESKEIIFQLDRATEDWVLDINPDAEELKRLRQIEVDFKDVANELRGETFKNIGLRQDLIIAKLRYEHLRSKWWNRLFYWVKFQFTMLKYKIKYALH